MALGLLLRGAMAAHAERLAGQLRQRVPAALPVVWTAEGEACLDALLECSRARRVIAAEADTPQADARNAEIAPGLDVIDHRLHGDFIIAADRKVVFALALPRSVEHQRRDAAIQIRALVGLGLFLR